MWNVITIGIVAGIVLGGLNLLKRFLGTGLAVSITILFISIAFYYQGDWASLGYALLSVSGMVSIVSAEVFYRFFKWYKGRK